MTIEELAGTIEEIKKLTPLPGDFIVIRLKRHLNREASGALRQTLKEFFPKEQRVLIVVASDADISTQFGACSGCGAELVPNVD